MHLPSPILVRARPSNVRVSETLRLECLYESPVAASVIQMLLRLREGGTDPHCRDETNALFSEQDGPHCHD